MLKQVAADFGISESCLTNRLSKADAEDSDRPRQMTLISRVVPSRLERVTAETMAVNLASRGVMRKLGMRHVRTEVREWDDPLPGWEEGEVVYELTRAEWVASRA